MLTAISDPSEAHLDRFASASIPVHRLPVHAKRLVAAGHKVGVVRQIETAALKKAGDNRNAPFVRKLTNVYTKGTYIDENGELDSSGDDNGTPSGGYLLCLTESPAKGSGTDEKVDVGIIAVQPATGDIIYDCFEDGFMRREIETRLLHISPCEFLIVGELTKATDKLVQHLSGSSTNVFGDRSRVERVLKGKTMAAEAYSHVTQFYADKLKDNDERAAALLEKVLRLPEHVTICLSAMITHLTEYGLEHIFDLTKYFQSFSTRQHMTINGTTLESLEVYRNATDHSERGSLLWALDKTRTRFGKRLLRKWIGRPLLDQQRLEDRVAAVEELLDTESSAKADKLAGMLRSIRADLERSLIRIFYGKCTRPELLSTLQTLQGISMEFARVKSPSDTGFKSPLISEAISSLPAIGDIVTSYLDKINPDAARKDDKYEFFREEEEDENISMHKMGIAAVEQDLDAHRKDAAKKLSKKSPVTYTTVAGIEYLIEVSNTDLKHVPASWAKISGTKKLSRFHTPEVIRLILEGVQRQRALHVAAVDELIDLAVRVAGDVAEHRVMGRHGVQPVNRHHRKELLDRPAVRARLEQREVAEVGLGHRVVEALQVLRHVVHERDQLAQLGEDGEVEVLGLAPLLEREVAAAEQVQRHVQRLLRVVKALERVTARQVRERLVQIDDRLLGFRRRHRFGNLLLAKRGDAEDVGDFANLVEQPFRKGSVDVDGGHEQRLAAARGAIHLPLNRSEPDAPP